MYDAGIIKCSLLLQAATGAPLLPFNFTKIWFWLYKISVSISPVELSHAALTVLGSKKRKLTSNNLFRAISFNTEGGNW